MNATETPTAHELRSRIRERFENELFHIGLIDRPTLVVALEESPPEGGSATSSRSAIITQLAELDARAAAIGSCLTTNRWDGAE